MKKHKLLVSAYLAAVSRNLEYIQQLQERDNEILRLQSPNTVTKRENKRYLVGLQMYTNPNESVYDFTEIIQLVQFESPELLVKLLRQVHHNYSAMNINEMATALNKKEPACGSYSESIPNELYILKELADSIMSIKEVQ